MKMGEETFEISIICAVYNASATIQNFIESVRNQTIKTFELIIVDGGSSDGTVDILKSNSDIIKRYISEADNGIYDAWNKGIQLSKANWICFVGSDDILRPNFIEKYIEVIKRINKTNDSVDYISSKVNYVDSQFRTLRILGKEWEWNKFKYGMTTAHVGSMHNRNLFNQIGLYDTNYKIIGDYELLLRKKNQLKAIFIDEILVDMKADGMSLSFGALVERTKAQIYTAKIMKIRALFILLVGIILLLRIKLQLKLGINRLNCN